MMDHGYIEEQALVERYFRGDLPAAEESTFEEHFFGCARCQAELEVAREMGRGLKAVAAEQAVRSAVGSGAVLAWLARRSALHLGLLAATLLVALALPLVAFYNHQRQLDQQLIASRSATQELRQDLLEERQQRRQAGQRLADSESDWQAQREQLEARLEELAEKAGLEFGDYVQNVDVEQLGRPAREWVYPFAFGLLGIIVALQLARRRRANAPAEG